MPTDFPAGTATFLFTDIEGSTRLLHEHGERYADLLSEHRRALRAAFARYGGVEVDTQGDAFFVAFARASDAIAAARLAGAASRLLEELGSVRDGFEGDCFERTVEFIRASLGADADAEIRHGWELSLDEAAALALAATGDPD